MTINETNTITVVGQGSIRAEPDVMRVAVGAEAVRPSLKDAVAVVNAAMDRILAALRTSGIPEKDIQSSRLQVGQRHDHQGMPSGYQATNAVIVTVRDVEDSGAVLDAVLEAGGDDVRLSGVWFAVEDDQTVQAAVREAAFADAKLKAEQYARLAGKTLGAVVAVSELAMPGIPQYRSASARFGGELLAGMAVRPGEEEVTATVTVVWSLA